MCSPQVHNAMALSAIRDVVGKGDIFHLLADLIDRPVTHNLSEKPGFFCELCGAVFPYDLGFTHCPECGAELVDE